jgi:16S rRNA (uracil1498-N3)-methyltransferase
LALHRGGARVTRRFYVPPGTLDADRVPIDEALAQRFSKVLRLRPGDEVTLFDGSGPEAQVRFERLTQRGGDAMVLRRFEGLPEPRVRINLYQSITKSDRFEWLLEKATELGVATFTPLITRRAVAKPEAGGQKSERWRRIVVEAAEQCQRSALPEIATPQRFLDAIPAAGGVLLIPYEAAGETAPNIAEVLSREIDALFTLAEVSIFIGPEGGYEPAEVQAAVDAGAHVVSLGRRVLRSETAGLVAATLTLHACGELG